ncbi:MAG: hypothetical protein IH859_08760, partial [Chloroflexi bacterium]|nr:hypothetical protein [Chloroflexota bacterium]
MTKSTKNANAPSAGFLYFGLKLLVRLQRFGWEFGGITLLGIAGVTLLAMIGLTSGAWVTVWASWLVTWFGLGKYLVVASLVTGGVWMIYARRDEDKAIAWVRVIALELAFFASLALLTIIGELFFTDELINTLSRAEAGKDGGLVGWGIAEFLSILLGSVLPKLLVPWIVGGVLLLTVAVGGKVGVRQPYPHSTRIINWVGKYFQSSQATHYREDFNESLSQPSLVMPTT